MGGTGDHKGNGQSMIPAPLNPDDPLNAVVFSMGNNKDNFTTYPGMDGVPHRSKGVRYYKDDDPEHMRPQQGGQVQCRVFDLADDGQREAYEKIVSRVFTMQQRGLAMVIAVDRQFVQKTGTWRIYYEWIELFSYDNVGAKHKSEAISGPLRRRG